MNGPGTFKTNGFLYQSFISQCITIVVMLVVASTNASLISHVGLATSPFSHISYSTFHAPQYGHGVPVVSHQQQQHKSVPISHIHRLAAPYAAYTTVRFAAPPVKYRATTYNAQPATVWAKAPAVYTAQTRGSFHQALLEGHQTSQTSLNVAPAPETW
jgi:Cuticle protein